MSLSQLLLDPVGEINTLLVFKTNNASLISILFFTGFLFISVPNVEGRVNRTGWFISECHSL